MKPYTYRNVLKTEKNFRYVLAANGISRFGDSLDAIAYSWMVYQLTGSMAWLSVILGVNMIPTVLFQPLGGALTEYFNKKKVLVNCDICRGLIVLITCGLMVSGVLAPWHLLALTFLNSSVESLRVPNGLAILPQILEKENYKSAISLDQGVRRITELTGMGCAGIIIGGFGVGGALLVDAATFLASGWLLSFLKIDPKKGKKKPFQIKNYLISLKEGFSYFRKSDLAMMVCAICVLQNLCTLPIENLRAAYICEYLGLDVMAMSVGGTAVTIGMIAGAFLLPVLSKKVSEKGLLVYGGVLIGLFYFLYLLIGLIPFTGGKYVGYFVTALFFGVMNAMVGVAVQVVFVSRTPEALVGRIGGIFNALACSSVPVGSFVLAGLTTALSIRELYLVMGFLSMVIFMLIGQWKGMADLEG